MSKSGRPDEVGLTDVLAQTVGLHPPLQRYEIPAFDDPPLLPLVEANPETDPSRKASHLMWENFRDRARYVRLAT